MMNENDAPSGANPETDEIVPTNASNPSGADEGGKAEELDDDDPGFVVIYDSTPGGPDAPESDEPAPPEPVANAPPDSHEPTGTLAIVEAQLAEALKIMRDISAWVHDPQTRTSSYVQASHAVGELVTASATLAKVATRLQHGEPETRHRIIVERDSVSTGGGVARSRKRINHGGV